MNNVCTSKYTRKMEARRKRVAVYFYLPLHNSSTQEQQKQEQNKNDKWFATEWDTNT